MRIVPRESIPEAKLLRLAGNERPVEVEAVIDVNGRMKVREVVEDQNIHLSIAKVRGVRFAIIPTDFHTKADLT